MFFLLGAYGIKCIICDSSKDPNCSNAPQSLQAQDCSAWCAERKGFVTADGRTATSGVALVIPCPAEGFTVCRKIKQSGKFVPQIYLLFAAFPHQRHELRKTGSRQKSPTGLFAEVAHGSLIIGCKRAPLRKAISECACRAGELPHKLEYLIINQFFSHCF